ncbi:hypothetical protein K469DRAFT_706049 [Zopfia rhizophila CBS 207.26]|uniref:Uncharacterized protein n=1 Tax=Zopfia rhizophila CBS 207.26 TaxID=1314779 RepID=A0A6A6EXD6_9PEZI|nr:hypothetical protein K469DRAFT_706049 [Zopfia rhizophila CBS 207.26]
MEENDAQAGDLYQPLKWRPPGWQEICLFSLFHGSQGSAIRGRLFATRIEDHLLADSLEGDSRGAYKSEYEALSYIWGSREGTC